MNYYFLPDNGVYCNVLSDCDDFCKTRHASKRSVIKKRKTHIRWQSITKTKKLYTYYLIHINSNLLSAKVWLLIRRLRFSRLNR